MFFKPSGSVSWLIVFLGNPGPKYECTRHNAGFMAGDALAKKLGVSINRLRFKALTAAAEINGEKVLLMKPQTFMNLSGEAVGQAARFYKIPPERVLVVSDEISLPLGKLRVRPKGSAGGHNGLKSIIASLGSDAFPRIRIGVGAPPHPDYRDHLYQQLPGAGHEPLQLTPAQTIAKPQRSIRRSPASRVIKDPSLRSG